MLAIFSSISRHVATLKLFHVLRNRLVPVLHIDFRRVQPSWYLGFLESSSLGILFHKHQLATSFEAKSAGFSPTAAGTDIIGGLWQLKALLESGSKGNSDAVSKTIWIASDMMNESANLNMPALWAVGLNRTLAFHLIS